MPLSPPSPAAPVDAIAWHKARTPVTEEAYASLEEAAKKRAFTVAGVAQTDLIASVQAALQSALEQGTTLDDFKAAVGDKLKAEWVGTVASPASRLETIFRTNVQAAYNAGRHAEATDPDTLVMRPYWQFDAVSDGRTTPVCRACNGTVLPASDPWWRTHLPPLHFNCRSTFHALTRRQAAALGVAPQGPAAAPAAGFGASPSE